MSEGRQWSCRWSSKEGAYDVWVAARPALRGTGVSWQAAVDDLCGVICVKSGDGEPVLSFDPPAPVATSDKQWVSDRWSIVLPNGNLRLADAEPGDFTKGLCGFCGRPFGSRTGVPLRATGSADADLCQPWYALATYVPCIFSERALEVLSPKERAAANWYKVMPAPRARKVMWECVPKAFVARVAVKGWAVDGHRCPKCDYRQFTCANAAKADYSTDQLHDWACEEDVEGDRSPLRGFGTIASFLLLLPTERARELARHPRAKGTSVHPVGLVPRRMVDPEPKLPQSKLSIDRLRR